MTSAARTPGFVERYDALRQRYAQSLPHKAAEIAALWRQIESATTAEGLVQALQQAVHRLSGSAPAYGFAEVGAIAQQLDARLADWLAGTGAQRHGLDALRQGVGVDLKALLAALNG